jgi:predicted ATPase
MPFLTHIQIDVSGRNMAEFPYNIPCLKDGLRLKLEHNVTFFVGENGTGKSTVLEAIVDQCGFNLSGGNRNHLYRPADDITPLGKCMKLGWQSKVGNGFFMRAESFFNFADYLDELAKEHPRALDAYGGKSLNEQSHGESFLSLFAHQFEKGIYLLDEPEAALSPQRQLTFLSIIHQLEKSQNAQFIIATHSPILLSYPGAQILNFDEKVTPIKYEDTEHYQLTKNFLNNPDLYLRHLIVE